jgi:two-component system, chemotaxis family, sensor kinase CheA
MELGHYRSLFLEEAQEHLASLEREALHLEESADPHRLATMFRAAHTIKGSAQTMGFHGLAELTHAAEDLLHALRQGEVQASGTVVDHLLQAIDRMREMLLAIASDREAIDDGSLARRLRELLPDSPGVASNAHLTDGNDGRVGISASRPKTFEAQVRIAENCVLPYARALLAISLLQEEGQVLHTVPGRADLEAERFGREFAVYFLHNDAPEELTKRLSDLTDIDSADVREWHGKPGSGEDRAPEPRQASSQTPASATVRVPVARLEDLMDLAGEISGERSRLGQLGERIVGRDRRSPEAESFRDALGHLARVGAGLREELLRIRMVPIQTVFDRLPRVVRDLGRELNKEVRLEIAGGEAELDRELVEAIADPLVHILRNCIDHGIEAPERRVRVGKPRQGTVSLRAMHQDGCVRIEIEDDGAGIDEVKLRDRAVRLGMVAPDEAARMDRKQALEFIFATGVSTADQITEISGRGVGMDVVRANLQRLGGWVEVDSEPGLGTRFVLKLPLTLALLRGLHVRDGGVDLLLPMPNVEEVLAAEREETRRIAGQNVARVRGQFLPIIRLTTLLRYSDDAPLRDSRYLVVFAMGDLKVVLAVQELLGEQEVVMKSLGGVCGTIEGVAGAAVVPDGRVALIADLASSVRKMRMAV